MNINQLFKNLSVPDVKIDVVLDTDAYNEIDDQFALAYMLKSSEKINVKAIYAAPFFNDRSQSPADGMTKSYHEIIKLLKMCKREELIKNTYKGSENYLIDENTPVISDAAKHLTELAKEYSPEDPLYVVGIAAITNIASALLIDPDIAENIVIVWLGGSLPEHSPGGEFNMVQDIAAARVVFSGKAPLVQLPCGGVVHSFTISKYELAEYFKGKNELCDYLADNAIEYTEKHSSVKTWTKVIWDVTAVAWLLNDDNRFMISKIIPKQLPNYDDCYSELNKGDFMNRVYYIKRDSLMQDLMNRLTN